MSDDLPESPGNRVRRAATPSGAADESRSAFHERWSTLPSDVIDHACRRVGTVAIVFGSVWLIPVVLNNFARNWFPGMRMDEHAVYTEWPMPGNLVAGLAVAASIAVQVAVRRWCHLPRRLLRIGLAYQVVMAALVSALMHAHPVTREHGVSWLCMIILAYPSIVPSAPRTTLLVSLLVATLDPIFYAFAAVRGAAGPSDTFVLLWQWLPNYVAAGIAVVPSTIITGLGRQVSKARDLGSYQLQERIGRGGMGEVYRARHRFLARPAAIKLIRPELLGDGAAMTVERFRREAQAAATLRSPHTIHLYDFGVTDDGVFYFVMELLDGVDLETLVRRFGPLSAGRTIFLLRHACRSLGEAHARGMVHRDVKPSNIFTCRLGLNVDFVKVLDFGLVKATRTYDQETMLVTGPEVTTGTPAYMAPELALGDAGVDARADIYALACVGYWLLTGRLVFEADSPVRMMLHHVRTEPEPPSIYSELDVPPELDRLLLECLAKKPADRPSSMREVERRLEAIAVAHSWTKDRAEEWWDLHFPAVAPSSQLREETPVATVHIVRDETSDGA